MPLLRMYSYLASNLYCTSSHNTVLLASCRLAYALELMYTCMHVRETSSHAVFGAITEGGTNIFQGDG